MQTSLSATPEHPITPTLVAVGSRKPGPGDRLNGEGEGRDFRSFKLMGEAESTVLVQQAGQCFASDGLERPGRLWA